MSQTKQPITVQTVIDRLISPAGEPKANTVDTLKSGNPNAEVSTIAVMFMTTYAGIKQAVEAGADLIITHEPTFYNHMDDPSSLAGDPVYERKRALIEESGIAIFRLHDYVHEYKPDGILLGMLKQLEWESYADERDMHVLNVPEGERQTVGSIMNHLKSKLGIDSVLAAGGLDLPVSRFALSPGAPGFGKHVNFIRNYDADLLIAGETNEWETNEYVRDAIDMGFAKALLVIGHQKSEESGMLTVTEQLREAFPGIEVTFVDSETAMRRV
ncbi:transcriptional regulator [Paenibacillus lycopersici]|uniref:GTP cyclohydrolase 1 type 2 homolog n=1 Tax=Paenibacillus lycopersici TaxID=2704462 RepID=A0A6C0FYH2_9BACL|nr:Nif3-like dinuclear metal center hexameric protein [Paenibacillus lycopersici]QHT62158.1 transcriptional regulator [Paenibacillus lycopersici]